MTQKVAMGDVGWAPLWHMVKGNSVFLSRIFRLLDFAIELAKHYDCCRIASLILEARASFSLPTSRMTFV